MSIKYLKKYAAILSGLILMIFVQYKVDPGGHDFNFGEYMIVPSFLGNSLTLIMYFALWTGAFFLPYCVYLGVIFFSRKNDAPSSTLKIGVTATAILSCLFYAFKYSNMESDEIHFIFMNISYLLIVLLTIKFSDKFGQYYSIVFSFFYTFWLFSYAFPLIKGPLVDGVRSYF